MAEFIDAYNKNTGQKLPYRIDRRHLELFPHLSETPGSRGRTKPTRTSRVQTHDEKSAKGNSDPAVNEAAASDPESQETGVNHD